MDDAKEDVKIYLKNRYQDIIRRSPLNSMTPVMEDGEVMFLVYGNRELLIDFMELDKVVLNLSMYIENSNASSKSIILRCDSILSPHGNFYLESEMYDDFEHFHEYIQTLEKQKSVKFIIFLQANNDFEPMRILEYKFDASKVKEVFDYYWKYMHKGN